MKPKKTATTKKTGNVLQDLQNAKLNHQKHIQGADFSKLSSVEKYPILLKLADTCWEVSQLVEDDKPKIENLTLAHQCITDILNCHKDLNGMIRLFLGRIKIVRAWCYAQEKNFSKSLTDLVSATDILNEVRDKAVDVDQKIFSQRQVELLDLQRSLANVLGDTAYDDEDYDNAIKYYSDAARILEQLADDSEQQEMEYAAILADTYNNLAECSSHNNQKTNAFYFFSLAHFYYEYLEDNVSIEDMDKHTEDRQRVEAILLNFDDYYNKMSNDGEINESKTDSNLLSASRKRKMIENNGVIVNSDEEDTLHKKKEHKGEEKLSQQNQNSFFSKTHSINVEAVKPYTLEELKGCSISQLEKIKATIKEVLASKRKQLALKKEAKVMELK